MGAGALMTGCASQGGRTLPPSGGVVQSSGAPRSDASRRVVLLAFDTHGNRLDWTAFRQLEENGQGSSGADDALVDPTTLILTENYPLFSSNGSGNGDPALTLPAHGTTALSLAWPTSDGYSNLILDLPGSEGTYDFDELAAAQVLGDIGASLSARPWYHEGTRVAALYASAKNEYARAQRAKNERQARGAFRAIARHGSERRDAAARAGGGCLRRHTFAFHRVGCDLRHDYRRHRRSADRSGPLSPRWMASHLLRSRREAFVLCRRDHARARIGAARRRTDPRLFRDAPLERRCVRAAHA